MGALRRGRAATLVWVFFLLSGLTSLVYQVVWFRMLALVFGNTVLASSTVLSVFFLGLAVGSVLFGTLADRVRRPVALYGLLEGGIGLYAVLFPVLLGAVEGVWTSLDASLGHGLALNLARAAVAGLLLLPPTVLMGGTFPLITRYAISRLEAFREGVSILYFVNTAGAVIGTVLAGFILIAVFGIRTTTWLTAAVNLLILVGCVVLQRGADAPPAAAEPEPEPEPEENAPPVGPTATRAARFVLWGTLLSGFTSLTYEVVWMRAFTSFFGSSVYSFASILAAFLVGIAFGSLHFARRRRPEEGALRAFGEIQLRVALSVVLFLVVFAKIPVFIVWGLRLFTGTFAHYQLLQFVLVLLAMLYTTVNLGASFPAANAAYVNSMEGMGRQVGRVYACNTLGAIAGAFLAGFVLIPAIGMERTIWLAFVVNLLLGLASLWVSRTLSRTAWLWAAAALGLLLIVPRWDSSLLNLGIYSRAYVLAGNRPAAADAPLPPTPGDRLLREIGRWPAPPPSWIEPHYFERARVLYFREGVTSTVSVVEDSPGSRSLLINGKADASNNRTGDMRTQLLLAHLPVLLSPTMPGSALVLGLGSGTTLGSMERYPIPRLDCVEIEPAVAEAARLYFADVNHGALDDPRLHFVIADGRTYLEHAVGRYDVITSEPSNLWMAGCSNLFTREFFRSARAHLSREGIMCQWIHLYQISVDDVRVFLHTYMEVFPNVLVWVDEPDMLVLGSARPIRLAPELLARRLALPEIQAELAPSGLGHLEELLPLLTADTAMAERFSAGAPVNTDDRPILEFSAPRSLLEIHSGEIVRELLTGVPYTG